MITAEPVREWKADARERLSELTLPNTPLSQEMFVFISDRLQPDLFLTVRFNAPMGRDLALARVRRFSGFLERRWLGRNWYQKPDAERSLFAGFHEGSRWSVHTHILLRLPAGIEPPAWKVHLWSRWMTEIVRKNRIAPAGDVVVEDLRQGGSARAISYCLKNFGAPDDWFISTQFRSSR